jgi:hypothetical protein
LLEHHRDACPANPAQRFIIALSLLTARSSVDLPEPDRPISTRISPCLTVSEQAWTPRICPVCF